MKDALDDVKSNLVNFINFFAGVSVNPRFGFGYFRDETQLTDGFQNAQPLTINTNDVLEQVQNVEAIGGEDADEANLAALYRIATDPGIGWRKDSRRIVLFFGDNPGHEPTCLDGKTISRKEVIDALQENFITVLGVNIETGLAPEFAKSIDGTPTKLSSCSGTSVAAQTNQSSDITSSTGGGEILSTSGNSLISAMVETINAMPRTFALDDSGCDEQNNICDSSYTTNHAETHGSKSQLIIQFKWV